MQIDSAVLYIFRKELAAKIIPAQVRQIHQIDNRIIDIELFRSYEKPIHLIFDTYRPLIYITENLKKDNPSNIEIRPIARFFSSAVDF